MLALVAVAIRHYSSPAYLEKRVARVIGSDYRVDIESARYNPLRQTFSATGVMIVPAGSGESAERERRTRSWFRLPVVRASGVNFWALRSGDLVVDDVWVDRPEVRVSLARGLPTAHPNARRLPHEVLMSTGTRVRVGRLRVYRGDIRYSERAHDGARPGTFRFADFYATVTDLGNDPEHLDQPCVIDVQTRLADSGLLKATFDYDLSSRALAMNYRAAMGRMDATAFNRLLVNLKGIRIVEGTIDSLWADIRMNGDVATGTVRLPYHGLKLEMLDKNSHDQDTGDMLATLVYGGKAHESNPDEDDPLTVIKLRRERTADVSLIKFVWETVREGALRTAGVQ